MLSATSSAFSLSENVSSAFAWFARTLTWLSRRSCPSGRNSKSASSTYSKRLKMTWMTLISTPFLRAKLRTWKNAWSRSSHWKATIWTAWESTRRGFRCFLAAFSFAKGWYTGVSYLAVNGLIVSSLGNRWWKFTPRHTTSLTGLLSQSPPTPKSNCQRIKRKT